MTTRRGLGTWRWHRVPARPVLFSSIAARLQPIMPEESTRTNRKKAPKATRWVSTSVAAATRKGSIQVVHDDFGQLPHRLGTSRFVVHKPLCDCSKVSKMRDQWKTTTNHHPSPSSDAWWNALLVVPDTSRPNMAYACPDSSFEKHDHDPLGTERHLKQILSQQYREINSLYIRCANCLLTGPHANGFAWIASSDRQTLMEQVLHPIQEGLQKSNSTTEDDQALNGIILTRPQLQRLSSAKTRSQTQLATESFWKAYVEQCGTSTESTESEHFKDIDIQLGHHLQTMLRITNPKKKTKDGNNDPSNDIASQDFWFVMIQEKGRNTWKLDLPGGKRDLGEDSWSCMVRETLEETTLQVTADWWVAPQRSFRDRREMCNQFYWLQPPTSRKDDTTSQTAAKVDSVTKQAARLSLTDS